MTEKTLATFRLDADLWQAFQDKAKSNDSNASRVLADFVKHYVNGESEPQNLDANLDEKISKRLDILLDKKLAKHLDKHLDKMEMIAAKADEANAKAEEAIALAK